MLEAVEEARATLARWQQVLKDDVPEDVKGPLRRNILMKVPEAFVETLPDDHWYVRDLLREALAKLDEGAVEEETTTSRSEPVEATPLREFRESYRGPRGEIMKGYVAAGIADTILKGTTYSRVERGTDLNAEDIKYNRHDRYLENLQVRTQDKALMTRVFNYFREVQDLRREGTSITTTQVNGRVQDLVKARLEQVRNKPAHRFR